VALYAIVHVLCYMKLLKIPCDNYCSLIKLVADLDKFKVAVLKSFDKPYIS
jgi:hypothetical protein